MLRPPPCPTLFPYTTLFRSQRADRDVRLVEVARVDAAHGGAGRPGRGQLAGAAQPAQPVGRVAVVDQPRVGGRVDVDLAGARSEEHTSELQSHVNLVCRLLL